MPSFSDRLKELRIEKRLTQQQLADNFYLNKSSISRYERDQQVPELELLQQIADFFSVSTDYLLGNSDTKNLYNNPVLTNKDEKDIAKDLENTLNRLEGAQDGLMFDGEALDDETRELLKISLENSMRLAKQIAKKYTPNKYKK